MPSKVIRSAPEREKQLDSFSERPLYALRRSFVRFVQGLFGLKPPGYFHWDINNETTEIVITDEHPLNTTQLNVRPGVTFTRGPLQFNRIGVDDLASYDLETETVRKTILVAGVMHINCCARIDIESDDIAWHITEHIWLLRKELISNTKFFDISSTPAIGSPSPPGSLVEGDGSDEMICTTVAVPFQFVRTGQITPLNREIVKNLDIELSVEQHTGSPVPVVSNGIKAPSFYAAQNTTTKGDPALLGAQVSKRDNPLQVIETGGEGGSVILPYFSGRPVPISSGTVEESAQPLRAVEVRSIKID